MIKLNGEITEISSPPNQTAVKRTVVIWLDKTEESMDFTLDLEDLKTTPMKVGDKITIQIDKRFDANSLTPKNF